MRRHLALIALLSSASLSACSSEREVASGTFDDGDGGKGSYSVTEKGGETETVIKSDQSEVRIGQDASAEAKLPRGLKLYPGANVQSSITSSNNGEGGAMVSFTTDAKPDDVIAFYKKDLTRTGIKIELEANAGGQQMIGGDGAVVTVNPQVGDGALVTVIAGDGS